jgi:rhamnogalacturonyl hydrolase YesR
LKGWDPYDLKGLPLYLWVSSRNNFLFKSLQVLAYYLFDVFFPLTLRKMFGVRKKHNPKGVGLLLKGYVSRYKSTGKELYLKQARESADWLMNNTATDYKGISWGYPFDWQSKMFIPKGTPSSVVSCIIGDAFWDLYQVTKEKSYLSVCEGICLFLHEELKLSFDNGKVVCHSYTPIDDFQVHNANLFVAEYLLRVGNKTGEVTWQERGRKSSAYMLDFQKEDGSLEYWSRDHSAYKKGQMDIYHSGYEIRTLFQIWKHTKDDRIKEAYQSYYEFFKVNYLKDNGEIKINPK